MALAVISDIHGNIAALEAVLADIDRRGISNIVNLGDSLSGPFDAHATADRLMALDLVTVRGNHDRQLFDRPKEKMGNWEKWVIDDLTSEHLEWLKSHPLTAEAYGAFLCHATPESDEVNWLDRRGPDDRLVARDLVDVLPFAEGLPHRLFLCGHTHTPRVVRLDADRMVVNAGSVGCPAYLDTRMEPNFIHQTGTPDARYAIVEDRDGQWYADLIAVPYVARDMARLACAKGADQWAQAVTTGWFA